jgi:uncharacterized membrane protein
VARLHLSRLQLCALLASVAGAGVSIYLTMLHYAGFAPGCPVTGPINCEAVLSSPYAVIAGTALPTSAAGIAWFAVSAALWTRRVFWLHLAWSVAGLATVLYLVFIEIVRLGAICLWCTGAHVLVIAVVLITLIAWQARDAVAE